MRELTADETQEAERMVAELAEAEARTDGRPLLAVLKAHLALNQMPGGPYAVALVGALALLVVLMTGLTVLGLLV